MGTQGFGRYTLLGEIGSGGMASVHLARLTGPAGFTRVVAVKRLHADRAGDPAFVEMLVDEARIGARIHHPNVVSTLDVVIGEGEVLLVLEYVEGESLSRLLEASNERGERVPLPIAAAIVTSALAGLGAAHETTDERGARLEIIHRDVSPQNILVGADGITRVADFGIAKARGRLQSTAVPTLKGKAAYVAPEQVHGETSQLSDLFAVAAVAWELLAGRRLFEGQSQSETLANVMLARAPSLRELRSEVPPALDRAIRRGLARDPAKRYPSASAMAKAIAEAIPLATPTEVGHWMRTLGAEVIARHEELLARAPAESSEAFAATDLVLTTTLVAPPPGVTPPPRVAPPVVTPLRSRARWRRIGTVIALVIVPGAVVASGLALVAAGRQTSPPPSTTIEPTSATQKAPPPSSPPTTSEVRTAPVPVGASSEATDSPRGAGSHVRLPRPPPRASAKAGCDPPYTIDPATGIVTYRRDCFR